MKPTLTTELEQFARHLCKRHAAEQRDNPGEFKRRVVRLLKASLPPFPGRKPDPDLDRIERLRNEGRSLRDALAAVRPSFRLWNWYHRKQALDGVRDALRKRRKRRGPNGQCSSTGDELRPDCPDEPAGESA